MLNPTILIVEDVEQNRKILKKTALAGYESVLEAANGREALEVLKEHRNIDLILLDLIMPEMDGIEFLRNIDNRDKDIPIIVLSATAEVKMAVDSLRLGARDFIEKPYKREVIRKRVEELLAEREGVQQSNILFVGEYFSYGELQNAFTDKSENVFVASNFMDGESLLAEGEMSVVIADLSNNLDTIRFFLEQIHQKYPSIILIVTAKVADKVLVYDLVDDGIIRDMVLDPVDLSELSMTVMNALMYYQESEELRRVKNSGMIR